MVHSRAAQVGAFLLASALALCSAAFAADEFLATHGVGRGVDLLRIYDGKGNVVKTLGCPCRAMVFDASANLFVGDATPVGGMYPVWRYPYLGGGQWGPEEKYTEMDSAVRALAFDSTRGILYLGVDDVHLSNVYRCAAKGATPVLFCGVNDNSRQIQDMEVGPDGKVWLGLTAWGYLRFPLTPTDANRFKPELQIYNMNGSVGGFALMQRNGRTIVCGNVNGKFSDFGFYDAETGKEMGLFFTGGADKVNNYCLAIGPDRNGDGTPDIYVLEYEDRIRIYDGANGKKLGEMAEGTSVQYLSGVILPAAAGQPAAK